MTPGKECHPVFEVFAVGEKLRQARINAYFLQRSYQFNEIAGNASLALQKSLVIVQDSHRCFLIEVSQQAQQSPGGRLR